jgi:hypothetical protein
MNDCAIGFFDALPAIVAIHSVVASADGSNLAHTELAHFLFELLDKFDSAVRRGVAAVHKAVDENIFDFIFARHFQESEKMVEVRVDSAIAEEAEKMELRSASSFHGVEQERLAIKFAVSDELIDARAVHVNDAAGADIQMADFAVPHLSDWEADGGSGSLDQRVGEIFDDAVVVRLARKGDGVAGGFGAIAPAVKDGEDDGFWAFGHIGAQQASTKVKSE